MDLKKLFDPFPPSQVSWRVGATNKDKTKGIALAYIDARDVMDRLDDVCGPENWQVEYPFPGCCKIGILSKTKYVDGEWIWKSNGAGETKVEGEKGQYSDAFKRAAVLWGIGRYLYDLDSPWVELENNRIKKSELPKLNALLENMVRFGPGEKEEIYSQVRECLHNGDEHGLKEILDEYQDPDHKMKVWALFNSQERAAIRELMR